MNRFEVFKSGSGSSPLSSGCGWKIAIIATIIIFLKLLASSLKFYLSIVGFILVIMIVSLAYWFIKNKLRRPQTKTDHRDSGSPQ